MATEIDINVVDPAWAWSPYQPDAERPWDRAMAAHLYRRAGFAANPHQLDEAAGHDPQELVHQLVSARAESDAYRRQIDDLVQAMVNTGQVRNLAAVWLYRTLSTPDQLQEKMTLFWHGHFATSADKVQDAEMMRNQNEILRRHARGDFTQLVEDISRDPAMLVYLDSATNRKAHPNENYARELMELFCLGEGNYTEKDIQELARCFTGWEVKRKRFRFNRYQYDDGTKTILGQTGPFGGEDAVRVVLQQPAAPRFIVTKLVRYFVCDDAELSPGLLEPLARQFRDDQLVVGPTLERILGSQLFFSSYAVGRKIRSPVELAVGLLRAMDATTNTLMLAEELAQLGQGLYYPPNVKGWDGGRTWINSSTLLGRANLVRQLLGSEKTRFNGGSLDALTDQHQIKTPAELVDWLSQLLVAVPLAPAARERLVQLAKESDSDGRGRVGDVVYALSTLPEFQLA